MGFVFKVTESRRRDIAFTNLLLGEEIREGFESAGHDRENIVAELLSAGR